jgi:hypothetical protein
MLSTAAKEELKKKVGFEGKCDFEINRKSKWVVEISLVDGLCLIAKFKFHCKEHTMERLV